MQGNHHDHETLKPHTDVHKNREDEDQHHVRPDFLEQDELRPDDVATAHDPIAPDIWTHCAVHERLALVRIADIAEDIEIYRVGLTVVRAARQGQFAHQLHVPDSDDLYPPQQP